MRHDLVNLVRESAAEPLDTPDFDAMAARGHRQRTATRVLGGVASALVLLVAGVALWPSTPAGSPVISDQPTTSAAADDGVLLPAGWQELRVGGAVFGVPDLWELETFAEPAVLCSNMADRPTAYVATAGIDADGQCLLRDRRAVTLEAVPLSLVPEPWLATSGDLSWEPVMVNGFNGERLDGDDGGPTHSYRFPELDVWLQFAGPGSVAAEADAILATLARAPTDRGPAEDGTPYDADAQMRPDLMVASPDPAAPGEKVELTFPEQSLRGLGFVLERQLPDGSWDHVYTLTSSPADSQREPAWWPANNRQGWELLGVGGPGPDRVVIPETAEPGQYRICTANAGDEFCTPLRIEGEPGVPAVPTPAELQAPYEPLFDGLATPQGDGVLVATESRIDGLGAFVAAGQPLPLDQPNAVEDAPAGATFTVMVRDADTGDVVAEVTPDTPAGAGFDGPTTGPVGTRYVVEATLSDGDQTVSWTDAAVVTDLAARVDLALTDVARPGTPVEFVLVNRGPAGVVHGVGYQLDRFVDGSWVQVENPPVNAIGLILGPASLSEPLATSSLPGPGRYRLTTQGTYDQAGDGGPPESEAVSLEFTAPE